MTIAAGRPLDTTHARQRERWERIGLGIRLAYNPAQPGVLRFWLALGARLARDDPRPEAYWLQRSLRLLLCTAHDEAVPWYWRSVCLEHTTRPLARLRTLAAAGVDGAPTWQAQVDAAHDVLSAARCADTGSAGTAGTA